MSKHVSIRSLVLAWTINMFEKTFAKWKHFRNFKTQCPLSTMTGQHNVSSLRNLFVAGERCDPETFLGGRRSKRTLKLITTPSIDSKEQVLCHDPSDWFLRQLVANWDRTSNVERSDLQRMYTTADVGWNVACISMKFHELQERHTFDTCCD